MARTLSQIFTPETMQHLFPPQKADRFFEALYGDVEEGAYDIRLNYKAETDDELQFEFHLIQRPGKCLACNLTYGLPQVFSRHPIINVNGIIDSVNELLGDEGRCTGWRLGHTREISRELHVVPLFVQYKTNGRP